MALDQFVNQFCGQIKAAEARAKDRKGVFVLMAWI
jgi:hypothetical protein